MVCVGVLTTGTGSVQKPPKIPNNPTLVGKSKLDRRLNEPSFSVTQKSNASLQFTQA